MTTTLATKETGETLGGRISPELLSTASQLVADSFLRHSLPEDREQFKTDLESALDDEDTRVLVLGGLKAAGLGYKKLNGQTSVTMKSPRLSNPSPEEFSTSVSAALQFSNDAVEVLAEKGREVSAEESFEEWLETMEVAVRHQDIIIPGSSG